VDTSKGTFLVDHTDLSLGQAEPNGIKFNRHYDSGQRYINSAGMGNGWVNNYQAGAQAVAAPQAALGGTTPAQMAPLLAATSAALGIYDDSQHNPKNWTVSVLISKWGIDQLTKTGVSVQLGKDILQFIRQPNGVFTPPANSTWTLTKPSNYVVQEQHGNTYNFDSIGRLATVVNPYNQTLTLTYNGSGTLVTNVSDSKGRSLRFNYSGSPSRLSSISDSTGRSVSYGYTVNTGDGNLDLTSFTDPESKTSTFTYNTDHALKSTLDALNQLVTTNIYDGSYQGRVITQYMEGDTNKTWQVYWSDWQTVIKDPAGGRQTFFYDDRSRLVTFRDALEPVINFC
jgi:YD repeat-containing protein